MGYDFDVLEKEETLVVEQETNQLVVYNDDTNTFDHVIDTLIEVCKHETHQAEQCTYIIHYRGKCSVKEGNFDELAKMRNKICQKGISAEVE